MFPDTTQIVPDSKNACGAVVFRMWACMTCGRVAEPGVRDEPCPQCGGTAYGWVDRVSSVPKKGGC